MNDSANFEDRATTITGKLDISVFPGDRFVETVDSRDKAFFVVDQLLDAGAHGVLISPQVSLEEDH